MIEIDDATKNRITKKQTAHLWGQPSEIEPVFIEAHLGDGMQLVAITPLNTRPNYYVIRVDSTWSVYNRDEPALCEHLDEIYDAIEDQVGRKFEYDDDDKEIQMPWPAFDSECGCSWSTAMDLLQPVTERTER